MERQHGKRVDVGPAGPEDPVKIAEKVGVLGQGKLIPGELELRLKNLYGSGEPLRVNRPSLDVLRDLARTARCPLRHRFLGAELFVHAQDVRIDLQ